MSKTASLHLRGSNTTLQNSPVLIKINIQDVGTISDICIIYSKKYLHHGKLHINNRHAIEQIRGLLDLAMAKMVALLTFFLLESFSLSESCGMLNYTIGIIINTSQSWNQRKR